MDFIEGLRKSTHKSIIMVEVDRLSEYANLRALAHPSTSTIAKTLITKSFPLMVYLHPLSMIMILSSQVISCKNFPTPWYPT